MVLGKRYEVAHATNYFYSEPVALCHNEVHLQPRATMRQSCLAHELSIVPTTLKMEHSVDYFGNQVSFFTLEESHREFSVTSRSEIVLTPSVYIAPEATPPWGQVPSALRNPSYREALEASQFVYDSPQVTTSAALRDYAAPSFTAGRPWLDAVLELTTRIYQDFQYDPEATSVGTPLATVLEQRRGVCQDFAHLQIGCLRSLGLAARYVSGYLLTNTPAGQPQLVGADASHAWLAAWCPGLGWVDFDPTNNVVPCFDHITVAWGRDYGDVCPIKGVFVGGGQHSMRVSVDVRAVENGRH
ncbi:MAG: transglutaminase N-terminal domain-containing protein [Pirellulales bacterium]